MEGTHSENPGLGATPKKGIFSNPPHLPKRKVSVLVKDNSFPFSLSSGYRRKTGNF